ncbi:MAG: hypothetical protein B6I23_01840 [Rickettsiaceae bacterium 4572_127]|nr:MAG: hypothetical protein B6I23_01840 [Rickettsiaceae bacterium 4572_127]
MYRIFLVLFLFSQSVSAFYFSASGDLTTPMNSALDENIKSAYSVNLSGGINTTKQVRLELNFTIHEMEKENAPIDFVGLAKTSLTNVKANTKAGFGAGFLSAFYDFTSEGRFSPFIGIGLGVGKIEYALTEIETAGMPIPSIKESETNMISKFSIGARYYFSHSVGSVFQYNFFKSPFLDTAKQYGLLSDSEVNLGVFLEF